MTAAHCAYFDEEEQGLLRAGQVHITQAPATCGPGGSTVTGTGLAPRMRGEGLDVALSTNAVLISRAGMVENMRAAWQMYNELAADSTSVLPADALAMATRSPRAFAGWRDREP